MIELLFEKLGFHPSETTVYLGLADCGKTSAQLLAKRLGLPRTTVYSVLDNLAGKGLVSVEKKRHTSFYAANKPQAILRLLEAEKQELLEKERVAREAIELAQGYFRSRHYSVPKLQFFEGRKSIENLLYDYLEEWRKEMAAADGIWWGYQDHTFVEQYRRWLEYYWSIKTPQEKIQLISNVADIEEELRGRVPGREIRTVGKKYQFSSTIWVCGDYIVLIMSGQEPHYAVQLKDAVFAANLRQVFALLWSLLG